MSRTRRSLTARTRRRALLARARDRGIAAAANRRLPVRLLRLRRQAESAAGAWGGPEHLAEIRRTETTNAEILERLGSGRWLGDSGKP